MSKNDHRITHNKSDKDNLDDDFSLFRDEVKGVKKLRQDTILHAPNRNPKQKEIRRTEREASDNDFYFSDEFMPHLTDEGPTRYARSDVSKYEVKRLRRGVYVPMCFGYARHDSARSKTRIGSDDRLLPKGECALCLCAARYWQAHLETERPTLVGAAPRCAGVPPSPT